jgi:DNA-binding transcriptional ArsR family regulator
VLDSYIAQRDNTGVDIFQALADPVRRSIVEELADAGEASAGQLAEAARARFGITQPTTSKHLKALREAGLVTSTVAAQRRVYRLDPRPLADLADWATRQCRYWSLKLDALEQHLLAQPVQEERP